MKKYSEWQKYVREQSEKMRTQLDSAEKTPPKNKLGQDKPSPHAPRTVMQSPMTKRDVIIKRNVPVSVQGRPSGAATGTGTAPSPFVSVQDVWKAAEKSTKGTPPSSARKAAPRAAQSRPRVAPASLPAAPPAHPDGKRKETREEILERLVNPTLSLDEVAKIVGVCKATIRRYTAKGVLPHYRTPGNQRRFKLNDILQFLEEQRR
ncbi:MAG: helix-turn-helix domain-containing protein [bacterium]